MDDTKRGNISRLSDGEYGTEDPRLVNSGNIWRVRSFASSVLGSSIAAVSFVDYIVLRDDIHELQNGSLAVFDAGNYCPRNSMPLHLIKNSEIKPRLSCKPTMILKQ